ncbi:MAG: hypothetical protein VCD00_00335 [Candidatus Hydrogenedentota bacterium]
MSMKREHGEHQPGIKWGPFTARIPFIHTGVEWPEFFQGILVAAATGLALVPLLTGPMFGLTFDEAVIMSMISSLLISAGPLLFGEPFAAGWVTPALPLVLNIVLTDTYPTPTERFQVMTALSIWFAMLLLVLGITGLGKKIVDWMPLTLKGAIIMGAAIAAIKRVFVDEGSANINNMPIAMTVAIAVCLLLAFSIPIARMKLNNPWLAKIASLGLLPGFMLAGIVGVAVGEMQYVVEGESIIKGGVMNPVPVFLSLFEKVSPFSIGFPPISVMLNPNIIGLAFVTYIILFGDIVTGIEILKGAMPSREDEKVDFNSTRTHISTGIRNVIMSLFAPFFPTQGSLWTGVHVIIVKRWAEGRDQMDSLFSGISSYYFFGVPILFLVYPITTGLSPMLPIALSLTLVLTGFACAYVAMSMPKNETERGVVLLGATALAFLDPAPGLVVAVLTVFLLLGFKDPEPIPEPPESLAD